MSRIGFDVARVCQLKWFIGEKVFLLPFHLNQFFLLSLLASERPSNRKLATVAWLVNFSHGSNIREIKKLNYSAAMKCQLNFFFLQRLVVT